MSRKAKKAMAVALTAGMLASTAVTPVMAATQGWKQNSKGWWYQNADGTYPTNKWSKINGVWYFFDANGYMLANSWVKDSKGDWYYVGANGAMLINSWAKDKAGLWYWLTDDGSMFEGGWAKINGQWYFFNEAGVMQSGVVKVEGQTYYLGGNDQGWMQTGKVNVAGTEYNFGTDGACTDAAVPAAAKAFNKKGVEIAPDVEIEAVDGITGTITNALPDYKAEYGNVLIAGSDAYLKVLVSDKDGNPVANTPVSLRVEESDVYYTPNGDFESKGLPVQTTDANGYATFVIGADDSDITPTSGDYALLKLTATAVATNQEYKTDLAFATVSLGRIDVLNNDKPNDDLLTKISENAVKSAVDDGVEETTTIDGKAVIDYVSTQQVNEKGTTTNKVQLKLDPQIKIPYANATSVVDKYQKDVNKEVKEYSVYQNGGETSFKVEGIPAGLKYATLNFSSIDVSDYTKVEIHPYKAGTTNYPDGITEPYVIDGPITQKNFGYQIPVQKNNALDIVVKVISEGQVDDNQNAGLVVTDVTGLYDTKTSDKTKAISLSDSVKWTVVENKYSNVKTMTADDAKTYIPGTMDPKYTAEGNTYSYQVPVYPYTGNAILTVKDVNKKVVGYFTIPTSNIYKNGEWQNENEIVKPAEGADKAILVSYDEAFNNVGTITAKGNIVEVNSEATGITAIQAKVNLAGFEDEINLTNNTAYTSVHWSPIPNTVKAVESQDFYALTGQNITVKAQLVDNNGNKVSQSGQQITYAYGTNKTPITELGAVGETKVTATSYTATTDANGQATLKLTSGDQQALVDLLHATSTSYNVQLMIGDTIVTNANLRWVEPGLAFTSSVDKNDADYEKAITLDSTVFNATTKNTSELKTALAKDTGSNWIFGYEVVGETNDTGALRYVDSISGLKVDITKGGAGDITTTGMANGTAKLTSTKAGATTLTGTINEASVVSGTDVVFKVATSTNGGVTWSTKEYVNVGEGTPSIGASLNLPVTWGTVGTAVKIIAPKGTSLNVDGTETVYVKVVDEFGNVKANENVDLTVTYSNGTKTFNANYLGEEVTKDSEGKPTNIAKKTDSNGLVPVTIKASVGTGVGAFNPTTATISAKVGNETTEQTIKYTLAPTNVAKFDVVNANYQPQTGSSNPKVVVTFSAPVNKDTLNKDMFSVMDDTNSKNVAIDKVEIDANDNKKVVITLGNQHASGLNNDNDYVVTIDAKKIDGIDYTVCDTYGREIAADAEIGFTTVADKLNAVYNTTDGKVYFTVNGQEASGEEIIGVYNSDASGVFAGEDERMVIVTTASVAATKQTKAVTVTFYYNGSSVDVTIPALSDSEIATTNTSDINTVAAELDTTATAATTGVINLVPIAANGTTVVVAKDTDTNGILTIADNKVTVAATDANATKTATFTVKVTKGTGAQAGTASTKTYLVTVSGLDSYTVALQ